MTADNRHYSGNSGFKIESMYIVYHIDEYMANLNAFCGWQMIRPWSEIHIPSHGNQGRDAFQGFQHLRVANIAGMDNQVSFLKGIARRCGHIAVGIRYNAD